MYKLADSVSARLVQIFQEAMLTGVDGADLLRQVRLEVDDNDSCTLVMTHAYKEQVKSMHKKLEEEAEVLRSKRHGVA